MKTKYHSSCAVVVAVQIGGADNQQIVVPDSFKDKMKALRRLYESLVQTRRTSASVQSQLVELAKQLFSERGKPLPPKPESAWANRLAVVKFEKELWDCIVRIWDKHE